VRTRGGPLGAPYGTWCWRARAMRDSSTPQTDTLRKQRAHEREILVVRERESQQAIEVALLLWRRLCCSCGPSLGHREPRRNESRRRIPGHSGALRGIHTPSHFGAPFPLSGVQISLAGYDQRLCRSAHSLTYSLIAAYSSRLIDRDGCSCFDKGNASGGCGAAVL